MYTYLRRLIRQDDGATAVEYAVMLALILLVCIGSIALLGTSTASTWLNNSNAIESATFDGTARRTRARRLIWHLEFRHSR
jgi:pilus assembly protein Flp/PilA